MNWKPLFRYRLLEYLKGVGVYFAVIVALIVIFGVVTIVGEGIVFRFSSFGVGSMVGMLVFGIAFIREDLQLGFQGGVSRRTVFLVEGLAGGIAAALLALGGELLPLLLQPGAGGFEMGPILDVPRLFLPQSAPVWERFLISGGLHLLLLLAAQAFGQFCSLMFYRMNRMWTVITAVAAPVLLIVGLPWLIYKLDIPVIRLFQWLSAGPGNCMLFTVGLGALLLAGSWLLLRRAPVRRK